jgi:hypothetical protein
MGFLLSLLLAWSVISMGWNGELSDLAITELSFFALALAVGFFFPRTIGIGLTGSQFGSVITLFICLFRGDISGVFASVVIFGGAGVVQFLITVIRPGASASVGAFTGEDFWGRFRR